MHTATLQYLALMQQYYQVFIGGGTEKNPNFYLALASKCVIRLNTKSPAVSITLTR